MFRISSNSIFSLLPLWIALPRNTFHKFFDFPRLFKDLDVRFTLNRAQPVEPFPLVIHPIIFHFLGKQRSPVFGVPTHFTVQITVVIGLKFFFHHLHASCERWGARCLNLSLLFGFKTLKAVCACQIIKLHFIVVSNMIQLINHF